MTNPDCIFCKIVAGTIPVERLYETPSVVAFPDVSPQAPTHLLVIPKDHVPSLAETGPDPTQLLGELLAGAAEVARSQRLEGGFRVVINTGDDGGQTVQHLHLHVLGGRSLHWPPG